MISVLDAMKLVAKSINSGAPEAFSTYVKTFNVTVGSLTRQHGKKQAAGTTVAREPCLQFKAVFEEFGDGEINFTQSILEC